MGVKIRTFRPSDAKTVRKVLIDGLFSNIDPAFFVGVRRPSVIVSVLVLTALMYYWTLSLLYTIAFFVALLCLYYLTLLVAAHLLTMGPLFDDIENVQGNYMKPRRNFWVAEADDGQVVGTIAITLMNLDKPANECADDVAWLRRMAVSEKYRRQGIAKRLVETAIEFCKRNKYRRIELITTEVQLPAKALYEKMGFRCVNTWARREYGFVLWTFTLIYDIQQDTIYY
ncbi:N-acetylaspartate synthetase-like [Branchiostoma floridae x Branchiostoma japonicum]